MTVLTSSSHRAGQGVSQDHFGSLIHHMVLEITLGSHFRLRSHFLKTQLLLLLLLLLTVGGGGHTRVILVRKIYCSHSTAGTAAVPHPHYGLRSRMQQC